MLAIPTQPVKKRIKIRTTIKIRRMKNHRKNENGNKKRKKHLQIKTPVANRETKYIYNGGQYGEKIKWLSSYKKS